ncbi:uncharacterized protein LOC126259434 [Schistocerca nitens]|uniref:uncharacterized protein LOC126259434 n=1 Tax=Schistocerca nitens TaxID=7011 RepID=UPI002117CA0C|nr:uncharacterized protein LOC126259434 [Schistocerca nitens]
MKMLEAEYDCACPGPPPQFQLPPPPLPPLLLREVGCSADHALYSCDVLPVLDAELHSGPGIPPTAMIALCSALLLATVLAASVLLCRYRRKVPNLVTSCKASPQNRVCDVSAANDVIYEDLTNIRPRPCTQPLQMRDLKEMVVHPVQYPTGSQGCGSSVFVCPDRYSSEGACTPVYQEIGQGRCESDPDSEVAAAAGAGSEDDFAEDELSLEDTNPPRHHLSLTMPHAVPVPAPHAAAAPPPWLGSLLRYHAGPPPTAPPPAVPPVAPYETVPVPGFSSFRPAPAKALTSHDSDSGYSHNTSGGRRDAHSAVS